MACLSRVREVPARYGEHRDPPSLPGSEVEKAPDAGIAVFKAGLAKKGLEDGCADSVSARIRRFANHVPLTKATGHEHAKRLMARFETSQKAIRRKRAGCSPCALADLFHTKLET